MQEAIAEINPEAAEASLREALNAPAPEATNADAKSDPESQQTATEAKADGDNLPDSLTSGTQATADNKPAAEATTKKTETQTDPNAKKQSDFAKNAERLDKTWKAVNERKVALDATEAQLKQREQAIAQREQKAQLAEAKAKNAVPPERHEAYASELTNTAVSLDEQAEAWEAKAQKLDDDGSFKEAEKAKAKAKELREEAIGNRRDARRHKELAENLRKNPDKTLEQHQAQLNQHLQHYTMEAAKKWPDLAVKDSEFQKQVVLSESVLANNGLPVNEYPVLRYFVAEFVSHMTAAARVPKLEKELGAAQARVKELEGLTAPGGGTSATQKSDTAPVDFAKMTLEQQEAYLRAESRR